MNWDTDKDAINPVSSTIAIHRCLHSSKDQSASSFASIASCGERGAVDERESLFSLGLMKLPGSPSTSPNLGTDNTIRDFRYSTEVCITMIVVIQPRLSDDPHSNRGFMLIHSCSVMGSEPTSCWYNNLTLFFHISIFGSSFLNVTHLVTFPWETRYLMELEFIKFSPIAQRDEHRRCTPFPQTSVRG